MIRRFDALRLTKASKPLCWTKSSPSTLSNARDVLSTSIFAPRPSTRYTPLAANAASS